MCRDVNILHRTCGCTIVRTQHCQQYYDNKSQEKEKAKGFFSRFLSGPRKGKSCKRGATADIYETGDGLCGKCYANSVRAKGRIVQGDNGPRIVLEGIDPSRPQPALMKEAGRQAGGPVAGMPLHGSSIPRKPVVTPPRGNVVQQLFPGTPSPGPRAPPKHIAKYRDKPLPLLPLAHSNTSRKLFGMPSRGAIPCKPTSSQNKLTYAESTRVRRPTPSEELRGPGWRSDKLYFNDELIAMGWGSAGPQRNENESRTGPELKSDKLYFTDELIDIGFVSSNYSGKSQSTHSQESKQQGEDIMLWPEGRTPRRPRGPMVPVRIPPNVATGRGNSGTLPHASENLNGSGSGTTSSGHQPTAHRSRSNLTQVDSGRGPLTSCDPTGEAQAQGGRRPRRHIDSQYDIGANRAISAMPGFFGSDGCSDQVDPIIDMINDVERQWNQAAEESSKGRQQTRPRPQTHGKRLL